MSRSWVRIPLPPPVPLSTGIWTHDYRIGAAAANEPGLSVSTEMPDDILELMKLYPQLVRTQSSGGVEYLPVPRHGEEFKRAARG